jgi:membrane associated rhomboid family serine protease
MSSNAPPYESVFNPAYGLDDTSKTVRLTAQNPQASKDVTGSEKRAFAHEDSYEDLQEGSHSKVGHHDSPPYEANTYHDPLEGSHYNDERDLVTAGYGDRHYYDEPSRSKSPLALGTPSTSGQMSGYSEDDLNKYPGQDEHIEESPDTPLVRGANQGKTVQFQDLEYAEPSNAQGLPPKEKGLKAFFSEAKTPLEQRIENKKRGIGRQKYPVVVYALTTVMLGVLIYELVLNNREQGSPISLKPAINPMLGPSSSALVFLGARFPPCMKLVDSITPSDLLGCMSNKDNPVTESCTVESICGFGGFHNKDPNQWFRFITPIFLHAGIIHYVLNMLAQLTLSAQIEREMGSTGFLITYLAAGTFGNVLGGNFALVGVPSVGASGAIFGTVAVTWVDLFAHWKYQYRPVKKLMFMIIELIIGIAVGYIPYVDNFGMY